MSSAGTGGPAEGSLRVVDIGTADAWRSQSLWHGLASAMGPDSPPTLSFCRPGEPYVGLGYHRRLDEIDLEICRAEGWPVVRRRIGGGPVYLDEDQLFFQITLPAGRAPARVDRLYERFLEPAAAAFRRFGLDVRRNGLNDLAVDDRKVSGTGAGQIGGGITVVGNVLFRFPHGRMARALALPDGGSRDECLRLLRRYVSSLEQEGLASVGFDEAREALTAAYAAALDLTPKDDSLTPSELAEIERWERRFRDPEWLAGPQLPAPPLRQIKVSTDAWIVIADDDHLRLEASIVGHVLERLRLEGPERSDEIADAVVGRSVDDLPPRLEPFGDDGPRVLRLLMRPRTS